MVLACLIAIFLSLPSAVFAHSTYNFPQSSEGQVNEALAKLVPVRFFISSPLYYLISFKESVNRFFQPSAVKKAEFDTILAGKKLKEVYLLLEKGDVKNAGRTMALYSLRMNKLTSQLERARSQNQEVSSLVDLVAENLRVHETLFFAINKKWELMEDKYNFDFSFAEAVASHAAAVRAIDNVKPGLRDRFTTDGDGKAEEINPQPYPTPYVQEASPSVKPKRVIL